MNIKYLSLAKGFVFLAVLFLSGTSIAKSLPVDKQRLIVLTDIGNEPDDMQSAIRLMLYSNVIDIEGLIASTSIHQKEKVHPEILQRVVSAYGKVRKNLLLHASDFPKEEYLQSVIKSGLPAYGMEGVGKGKDSEGSNWIIKALEKNDSRPLWITAWGGTSVLAQALFDLKETKSAEELARLIAKLRIYTISDQDDAGYWIRSNFQDLFYIASPGAYNEKTWSAINKVIQGIDNSEISNTWLRENIQQNNGALGSVYPDVAFGMEGDTPSWLMLIPNGLNIPEHPEYGGWGGRYVLYTPKFDSSKSWIVPLKKEIRPFYSDVADVYTPFISAVYGKEMIKDTITFEDNFATLLRWRKDFQNDFAARIQWCTRTYKDANHPPIVKLKCPKIITVKSGETFILNGESSYDPDGDSLSFLWFQYIEAGTYPKRIPSPTPENIAVQEIKAPKVTEPQTTHYILRVTDKGLPALTRYERVIVNIVP